MSQVQGDHKEIAFDGRIQLDGDDAPELEVLVELSEHYVILGHSSGELGRWERPAVHVAPIGRGWFTIDVEDEQVSFLPRRPGYFAAATIDMLPVEGKKKKRSERKADKKAARAAARKEKKKPEAPSRKERTKPEAPSRKERTKPETSTRHEKRKRRRDEGSPAAPSLPDAPRIGERAPEEPPATRRLEAPERPAPEEAVVPEKPPAPPEPAPEPLQERPAAAVEASPELPAAPTEPQLEPSSPWDDLPVPEVPGRVTRRKTGRTPPVPSPEKVPKVARRKPSQEKTPRRPPEKPVGPAGTLSGKPAAPKKTVMNRASTAFWHGFKGFAFRVSDELRQTGIVPFDRLPAAPARSKPAEDHKHHFEEHRLPGGLIRNVCHDCGLVSIGESGGTR